MLNAVKRRRIDAEYFKSYGDLRTHALMLQDKPRNEAYQKSIEQNWEDFNDKVVLDVGTGSGILAMMAAKRGAKRVHAVEANASMATIAENLIRVNGLEDIITVHACRVEDLVIHEKVDTIVSEWMGFYLVHEAMLESVLFARDKFLKSNGRIYPEQCVLWACPLDLKDLYDETKYFQDVCGFDFSSEFAPDPINSDEPDVQRGVKEEHLLAAPQELLSLDLRTMSADDARSFSKDFEFRTIKSGYCGGLGLWFDCTFPASDGPCFGKPVVLDTSPKAPRTHWVQAIVHFGQFTRIAEGKILKLTVGMQQSKEDRRKYDVTLSSS